MHFINLIFTFYFIHFILFYTFYFIQDFQYIIYIEVNKTKFTIGIHFLLMMSDNEAVALAVLLDFEKGRALPAFRVVVRISLSRA